MQTIVFLGIFDKIANWIFSGVSKAISWLVSNIIAPICSAIWQNFLVYIWKIVTDIVFAIFYQIYVFVLTILYSIETAALSFGGARNVSYGGESNNILSIIFGMGNVKSAFVYITCISLVLLFIFTVVAVMRSTIDFNFDGRRSVSVIMTNFATSCITFLVLPVFCYGLVDLSSRCMTALFTATSMSGCMSITDNLFLMSVKSSVADSKYDAFKTLLSNNTMYWSDLTHVNSYIGGADGVDYFVGFIGAILLIVNLLGMCAVFIQRVLEVVILYVVSPFFVATMPLDDGERFNKWRRTFIGRLCMGVGMIVGLNIVMMVISLLISGSDGYTIYFTDTTSGSLSNLSLDIFLKLIFMICAISSVKHVGSAITGIMDQDAAGAESHTFSSATQSVWSAPKNLVNTIQNAQNTIQKIDKWNKNRINKNNLKQSKEQGFQGETANSAELDFTKSIRKQNSNNAKKAALTHRGAKLDAINDKIDQGNETLKAFSALKTHEERKEFMKNFNKQGGTKALKAKTSGLKTGAISNFDEMRAGKNLSKRLENEKAARDQFEQGSKEWNKHNNKVNKLAKMKREFDNLSTHKEREAFMANHKKEMGDTNIKTPAEWKTSKDMDKRIAQAKDRRNALPQGSAEREAADREVNKLTDIKASYDAAASSEERKAIVDKNKAVFSKPASSRYGHVVTKATAKMGRAIEARDACEKGSPEWNKLNKEVNSIKASINKFNKAEDPIVRDSLISKDPAFKDAPALSAKDNQALKNINNNMERIKTARDKCEVGSAQWNKLNAALGACAVAKYGLSNGATQADRDKIISANEGMFADNNSKVADKAMENLDKKILTAKNSRDLFEKGSKEWNTFNDRVNKLTQLGSQMQSLNGKEARENFVKAHSQEFSDGENLNSENTQLSQGIDANIQRAFQNRDRHKEGSAKWNAANAEVQDLLRKKAVFDSFDDQGSKTAFANRNKDQFTDKLSDDTAFEEIQDSMQSWQAVAASTDNPALKEHARKMAKSYGDYSEAYQKAGSAEERKAVADRYNTFETEGIASLGGIAATPKEAEGLSTVAATRNDVALKNYVNASTHAERAKILKEAREGKIQRFESQDSRENDFGSQLSAAGETFAGMAEKSKDRMEAAKYTALSNYCNESAKAYGGLSTHAQREALAGVISKNISSAQEKVGKRIDTPVMQSNENITVPLDETEQADFNTFFGEGAGNQYEKTAQFKHAYVNAGSHGERLDVLQRYGTYMATAPDSEKPGAWNGSTSSFNLSAEPSEETVQAVRAAQAQDRVNAVTDASASIDTNIARAISNRDRHKEGSAKWNTYDAQVKSLNDAKTQLNNIENSDDKYDYVQSNSAAFSDNLSSDAKYAEIEQNVQTWANAEATAKTPEAKEYAHKMAKSYASYSEAYQSAPTPEAKAAVADRITAYESGGSSSMGGVAATPKEYEGLEEVRKTGNQEAVSLYMKAASHTERSQILKDAKSGAISRYEVSDKREADFSGSLASAGSQFVTMAKQADNDADRAKYYALSDYCSNAAQQFNGLTTHAQRDSFARMVSSQISGAQTGFANVVEAPKMASLENQTLEYTIGEKNFLDATFNAGSEFEYEKTSQFKLDYVNATSHQQRADIMDNYSRYVAGASDSEKPGVWNSFDTAGLTAAPPEGGSYESFERSRNLSIISGNIQRATESRDRYEVNSPQWTSFNDQVNTLTEQKQTFESFETDSEASVYAANNSASFTNEFANDPKYNEIEHNRQTWMGLAASTTNPQVKEHASQMAAVYGGYSESYQRAETPEARQAVVDSITSYENADVSVMQGVRATPDEINGYNDVSKTRNERVIRTFVNSTSHAERSRILNEVRSGSVTRYECEDTREIDYGESLSTVGTQFQTMANEASDADTKARYESLTNYCSQANVIYSGLTTHAQREAFSRYVNSQITSAQGGLEYIVESPQMDYLENQTLDFSADENNDYNTYFNNSSDGSSYEDTYKYRREYICAVNHTDRKKVLDEYIAYTSSATPEQQPGGWNNIDMTGLPTLFIPEPVSHETAPEVHTRKRRGSYSGPAPKEILTPEERQIMLQNINAKAKSEKLPDRTNKTFKSRLEVGNNDEDNT